MWLKVLVFICFVPTLSVAQNVKTFTLTGATWNSPGGSSLQPLTIRVEEDGQDRITRISINKQNAPTDVHVVGILYTEKGCHFSFVDGLGVATKAYFSWLTKGKDSYDIRLDQQNRIPKQVFGSTTYPARVLNWTVKIALKIGEQEYSWNESGSNQGDSQYVCNSGQKLVHEIYEKRNNKRWKMVLDGYTSDASPMPQVKMIYSKKGDHVVGKQFWTYAPTVWKNNKNDFLDGGSIEYYGDSLSSHSPLTNVVNYYILSVYFDQETWSYFGPSLFNIPIQ